jgi:hypothetical protein
MTATIERVTTAGAFNLDGDCFQVENNIWLIGKDTEVGVVDAAHELEPCRATARSRRSSPKARRTTNGFVAAIECRTRAVR